MDGCLVQNTMNSFTEARYYLNVNILVIFDHHNVSGSRYNITHYYCLEEKAGFNSDVVECLPVDPASWVRFLLWDR